MTGRERLVAAGLTISGGLIAFGAGLYSLPAGLIVGGLVLVLMVMLVGMEAK